MAIQRVRAGGTGPYPETPFLPEIRSQVLAHLRWQQERLAEPPQEEPEAPEETEPEGAEHERPAEEDLVWAPCLLLVVGKVVII